MEFEQVKQYVDSVKDTERFKKILEFTRMTELKPKEDIYENIKYYLGLFHAKKDSAVWFDPDYDHFINFLEHYLKGEPTEDVFDERGYLDLSRTSHLVKPRRFAAGAGNSTDNHIMLTDGRNYVSKIPLNYNTEIINKYSVFSALIASYMARAINIEAPEMTLASVHNGSRILSKNFLKPNEELVVYGEDTSETFISGQLERIEQALRLRKFPEEEIDATKFEFLKQEFLAKIIGLRDQSSANSPLIISVDEEKRRHVRMPPMFDLDYSFHIGEETPRLISRKCDNGQEDIGSFIKQYKDYPGFEEFVRNSLQALDMPQIFRMIYEGTGVRIFADYQNNEQMNKFMDFANRNIGIAREVMGKVYNKGSEER